MSSSSGAIANLFPKGGYAISRTDAGQDAIVASGKPIGAIAPGTIVSVQSLGGWGSTIFEKLANPVDGFDYIYYALEGGAKNVKDKVGRSLKPGEQIAAGAGGNGIEVGFASAPEANGIEQRPFAGGEQTKSGISFAKALGLSPQGPDKPAKINPKASDPFTEGGGKSLPEELLEKAEKLPGEAEALPGEAGNAVISGIVGPVKEYALKGTVTAVLIIGGVALLLYGLLKTVQPVTGTSPGQLASKTTSAAKKAAEVAIAA